jgi:hypothetical protein
MGELKFGKVNLVAGNHREVNIGNKANKIIYGLEPTRPF